MRFHSRRKRRGKSRVDEPGLELAPATVEGRIANVWTVYRRDYGVQAFKRWQECARTVGHSQTHVHAVVVLEGDEVWPYRRQKFVHLCDRECWAA